jgi:hypothetical protein
MNNIPQPKRLIDLVPMEIRAQTERAHYHATQQYNTFLKDWWIYIEKIHWINWFGLFMIGMFGVILYLKYQEKEKSSSFK